MVLLVTEGTPFIEYLLSIIGEGFPYNLEATSRCNARPDNSETGTHIWMLEKRYDKGLCKLKAHLFAIFIYFNPVLRADRSFIPPPGTYVRISTSDYGC